MRKTLLISLVILIAISLIIIFAIGVIFLENLLNLQVFTYIIYINCLLGACFGVAIGLIAVNIIFKIE